MRTGYLGKRVLIVVAAVAVCAAVVLGSGTAFADRAGAPNEAADVVQICHFNGHSAQSPYSDNGDFFANDATAHELCSTLGGKLITVSNRAAVNGHGASELALFPIIEFDHLAVESDPDLTRYWYRVTNIADFPAELFVTAPELPPCGLNPNASRTWIDFFDQDGQRIYGYCAIVGPPDPLVLSFWTLDGEEAPTAVSVRFWDRQTNTVYESPLVAVPAP